MERAYPPETQHTDPHHDPPGLRQPGKAPVHCCRSPETFTSIVCQDILTIYHVRPGERAPGARDRSTSRPGPMGGAGLPSRGRWAVPGSWRAAARRFDRSAASRAGPPAGGDAPGPAGGRRGTGSPDPGWRWAVPRAMGRPTPAHRAGTAWRSAGAVRDHAPRPTAGAGGYRGRVALPGASPRAGAARLGAGRAGGRARTVRRTARRIGEHGMVQRAGIRHAAAGGIRHGSAEACGTGQAACPG